jgi:3-hydroxyisobutyrate dehydrogenase
MGVTKVAFVGLGAMGLPMARSLVRAGFETSGFDLRRDAVAAFANEGGRPASSVTEAADGADALLLMVVNISQAEQVLFETGALKSLRMGAIVILSATCPPASVAQLANRVHAAGYRFLDAPVSGGTVGAQSAKLSIMAAGPQETFEVAKPLLQAMGDKIFHVGLQPGQGSAMKTINQLLCGVHIAACAEAFTLAEKMGIDPELALRILGESAASSWMLRDRGPRMLEQDPEVTSAINIFVKDLGIVVAAGSTHHASVPLAELALDKFRSAADLGLGQKDDSQVVQVYRSVVSGSHTMPGSAS